uniref:Tetratricopeptide repeat protein n=1 Tax=viral metagenome TaxID=1070528 RepID=A0A6M3KW02_9ZZZZ
MYMTKMWFAMEMYRDDYYLVEFSCMEDPEAWYVWHIRGHKRWDTKSYREALTMWVMAKLISPKEFKILFNIALVLKMLKNDKESAAFLQMAEANIIPGQEKEAGEYIKMFQSGKVPLLL